MDPLQHSVAGTCLEEIDYLYFRMWRNDSKKIAVGREGRLLQSSRALAWLETSSIMPYLGRSQTLSHHSYRLVQSRELVFCPTVPLSPR